MNEVNPQNVVQPTQDWMKKVVFKLGADGVWTAKITVKDGELPVLFRDVLPIQRTLRVEIRRVQREALLRTRLEKNEVTV